VQASNARTATNAVDRQDLLPAAEAGAEDGAAVDRFPVDHDRTGAALGAIAAQVRAAPAEPEDHRLPQALADVDSDVVGDAVDVQRDPPLAQRQCLLGRLPLPLRLRCCLRLSLPNGRCWLCRDTARCRHRHRWSPWLRDDLRLCIGPRGDGNAASHDSTDGDARRRRQ